MTQFFQTFFEQLDAPTRRQLEERGENMDLLESLFASAREAWPEVTLSPERFAGYLVQRAPRGPSLQRGLQNWHVQDLYLCCACAAGDGEAIQCFRRTFGPVVVGTLVRLRLSPSLIDDVSQHVMSQLLVSEPQRPPMLAGYEGSGKLARWLRVVTARTARKMLHREKKMVPVSDEHLFDAMEREAPGSAELQRIKQIYRREFKQTFKQVLAGLPAQQANLMRYRFAEGLTLQQIGELYRVHHSTILRRLEQLKSQVMEQTLIELQQRLQVSPDECASVMRLIQSNFDLTLQTFMSSGKEPES